MKVLHLLLILINGFIYSDMQEFSELKSYEIIIPQKVTSLVKQEADIDFPEDQISYMIPIGGMKHIVHLQKNTDGFGEKFTIFTFSRNKSLTARRLDKREICYYHGYVEDVPKSEARISACSGKLSGLLKVNETWYEIVPLASSSTQQHLIYDVRNFQPKPSFCGVLNEHVPEGQHFHTGNQYHVASSTVKNMQAKSTDADENEEFEYPPAFVELFVVVDYKRYVLLQKDAATVIADLKILIKTTEDLYETLNLKIIIVGMEVWTDENEPIKTGSDLPIVTFIQYMQNLIRKRPRYDAAALITGHMPGTIIGLASVNGICTSVGALVLAAPYLAPKRDGNALAHELGHLLNMQHDAENCICEYTGGCIMASVAGFHKGFSDCSKKTYRTTIKVKQCLKNTPKSSSEFYNPVCGNSIVDDGEECDCGHYEDCIKSKCCNFNKCTLTPGNECAFGQCCEDCKISPAGTVCRNIINDCDLPEYCDGMSQYCPGNSFKADGTECQNSNGYCYTGQCQTKDQQCKNLHGSGSASASDSCYERLNKLTNTYGHCGRLDNNFISCENRSVFCGKLQCETVGPYIDTSPFPNSVMIPVQDGVCIGMNSSEDSDMFGEDMVEDGTRCGIGKMCINTKCVPVGRNSACDEQLTCNDNGVCNNNGNCHCDDGWAPPKCMIFGYGGSIDSGPPRAGSSKSNKKLLAILLPTLLGIPLLILGVVLIAKCRLVILRLFIEHHTTNGL